MRQTFFHCSFYSRELKTKKQKCHQLHDLRQKKSHHTVWRGIRECSFLHQIQLSFLGKKTEKTPVLPLRKGCERVLLINCAPARLMAHRCTVEKICSQMHTNLNQIGQHVSFTHQAHSYLIFVLFFTQPQFEA